MKSNHLLPFSLIANALQAGVILVMSVIILTLLVPSEAFYIPAAAPRPAQVEAPALPATDRSANRPQQVENSSDVALLAEESPDQTSAAPAIAAAPASRHSSGLRAAAPHSSVQGALIPVSSLRFRAGLRANPLQSW